MTKNIVWHSNQISKLHRAKLKNQKPFILWFTGLSASGKSTLANELERRLFNMEYHTYLLDGDNVRYALNADLKFSESDRVENIRRIGEVAKLFLDSGIIVITAFISPFKKDRKIVRKLVEKDEFIEIFVEATLETCENRDPKGFYKKARKGNIKHFTGIDSPYEKPDKPEISIKNNDFTDFNRNIVFILNYLKKNRFIFVKDN